jgi:hypothetical protein
MEGYGGPAQPSPTIGQCLNGGYGYLEVKCHRCETEASIPLDAVRRPRDTPIWKLEAALKCRSCRKGRYAPPVHMIKLTEARQTTPYRWVHPDEERWLDEGGCDALALIRGDQLPKQWLLRPISIAAARWPFVADEFPKTAETASHLVGAFSRSPAHPASIKANNSAAKIFIRSTYP